MSDQQGQRGYEQEAAAGEGRHESAGAGGHKQQRQCSAAAGAHLALVDDVHGGGGEVIPLRLLDLGLDIRHLRGGQGRREQAGGGERGSTTAGIQGSPPGPPTAGAGRRAPDHGDLAAQAPQGARTLVPSSKPSSNCLPCTVLNLSCILARCGTVIRAPGGLLLHARRRSKCQGAAAVPPLVPDGQLQCTGRRGDSAGPLQGCCWAAQQAIA